MSSIIFNCHGQLNSYRSSIISNTGKTGHWLRYHFIDPLFNYKTNTLVIINRNYEMTYTIHDLEPMTRFLRTYGLQEYFIPLENLKSFALEMLKILKKYKVNVINVSIRHALQVKYFSCFITNNIFLFLFFSDYRTIHVCYSRGHLIQKCLHL